MRVLAGLLPVLATLAQVKAQENQAEDGELDMDKVPADHRDLKDIPITTTEPWDVVVKASAASLWSSFSSVKSQERVNNGVRGPEATPTATLIKTTKSKKAKTTTTTTTTTKKKGKKTKTTTTATKKKKAAATTKAKNVKQQKRQLSTLPVPAINAVGNNTGCTIKPQGILNPYQSSPNTPTGFYNDANLTRLAAAEWLPPAGYWTSFQNQLAQVQKTGAVPGDAGLYIMYFQTPSYTPSLCAKACDVRDECLGFNIYFSRSPQWEPQYRNTTNPNGVCSNPVAQAEVGCGLYFQWIYSSYATNTGQWRADFALLTVGNNGYNKNPVPARQTNYTKAVALLGAVNGFSAPEYITYNYWTTAFDDSRCAAACTAYSNSQRAAAISNRLSTYEACNYYNTFNVTYQGTYQGQYCVLYNDTSVLSNGYMTYSSQTYNGQTYIYNLTNSFGTELYGHDPGTVSPAWSPAPTGAAASCEALGSTGTTGFTLLDIQRNNYTVACNYDLQNAFDVGNSTAPDFYSCFDLCDNFSGCSGFAWLPYTPSNTSAGVCYFKDLSTSIRNPTSSTNGADLAWLTSKYAGFKAGNKVATVTYTTYTTAWTGASTVTATSFNDLTGYIIVQTPGLRTSSTTSGATVTTTVYTDSGTLTSISTTTSAAVSRTVTVKIFYPTPTCGSTIGAISYAMYTNSFMGGQNTNSYPAFNPTIYKTIAPAATGVANYLAEDNADTASTTIYGRAGIDGRSLVMQHTFYLYAGRGTGRYYFQFPYSDDISLLWVGDKAVSGWNRTNNDLLQFWNGQPQTPTTASFFLSANTWTPVRVQWGNGGGQGDLQFSIIDPNGNYLAYSTPLANSGYLSPQILKSVCSSANAGVFPAWGRET